MIFEYARVTTTQSEIKEFEGEHIVYIEDAENFFN